MKQQKLKPLRRPSQLKVGSRIYAEDNGDKGERAIGYVIKMEKGTFSDTMYYTMFVLNINRNNEVVKEWAKEFPSTEFRNLIRRGQVKYFI